LARPVDHAVWVHYLEGLWRSGLRLEESTLFSWEEDSLIYADLAGKHPRLRIYCEADKGGEDRLLPATPDFSEFLLATPKSDRQGRVFKINSLTTGKPMTVKRISRIITAFGTDADIVVNKATGKFASAHDLRRSFGTRWAALVKPATLQLLMRHKSVETTMKYYVDQDADEVAEELWRAFGSDQ
jgi:integrase